MIKLRVRHCEFVPLENAARQTTSVIISFCIFVLVFVVCAWQLCAQMSSAS